MNKDQKKRQVWNIILFLLLAFLALALVVTCTSAFAAHSPFRAVCGAFTLVAGFYAIYKASRKVMEPFTKDEENL